jgi:hypothetical protein
MDANLPAAARRVLRSADAALVELASARGAARSTPFVLSHEGRPVLPVAVGLVPEAAAVLRVEALPATGVVGQAGRGGRGLDRGFAVDQVSITTVPEPGQLVLAAAGALALASAGRGRGRRRCV